MSFVMNLLDFPEFASRWYKILHQCKIVNLNALKWWQYTIVLLNIKLVNCQNQMCALCPRMTASLLTHKLGMLKFLNISITISIQRVIVLEVQFRTHYFSSQIKSTTLDPIVGKFLSKFCFSKYLECFKGKNHLK